MWSGSEFYFHSSEESAERRLLSCRGRTLLVLGYGLQRKWFYMLDTELAVYTQQDVSGDLLWTQRSPLSFFSCLVLIYWKYICMRLVRFPSSEIDRITVNFDSWTQNHKRVEVLCLWFEKVLIASSVCLCILKKPCEIKGDLILLSDLL